MVFKAGFPEPLQALRQYGIVDMVSIGESEGNKR